MELKQTKHQVARSTRPDAETYDKFLLIKRVFELHATYQIRLLAYRAIQEQKKLIIEVPKKCRIHDDLRELTRKHPKNVVIARA